MLVDKKKTRLGDRHWMGSRCNDWHRSWSLALFAGIMLQPVWTMNLAVNGESMNWARLYVLLLFKSVDIPAFGM
jgi:hypothetical protein